MGDYRRVKFLRSQWGRTEPVNNLCYHHTAVCFRGFSGNVCSHYRRFDYRGGGRAHQIQFFAGIFSALVHIGLLPGDALGLGQRRLVEQDGLS